MRGRCGCKAVVFSDFAGRDKNFNPAMNRGYSTLSGTQAFNFLANMDYIVELIEASVENDEAAALGPFFTERAPVAYELGKLMLKADLLSVEEQRQVRELGARWGGLVRAAAPKDKPLALSPLEHVIEGHVGHIGGALLSMMNAEGGEHKHREVNEIERNVRHVRDKVGKMRATWAKLDEKAEPRSQRIDNEIALRRSRRFSKSPEEREQYFKDRREAKLARARAVDKQKIEDTKAEVEKRKKERLEAQNTSS